MEDTSLLVEDLLSTRQRLELESLGDPVTYPPNHTIFWEGQPSHAVLIIQSGNLKVTREADDGTETILAIRGAEEVMGEEGVLMDEPRSATVTTINDVTGILVRADALLRFVEEQRLWPMMYRAAVRRRRQLDQQRLHVRLNVRNRLARWLVELATDVGEPTAEGWVIDSSLSQEDLASHIGASRVTVANELRRLRERGLISTGQQRIVLHDLEGLRMITAT